MAAHQPGDRVRLGIRSGEGLSPEGRDGRGRIARPATNVRPERAVLGVLVVKTATQIKLPIPVNIDAGSIGGPSAGLAFALDVLEELGRDVTAATRSRRRANSTRTAPSARSAA